MKFIEIDGKALYNLNCISFIQKEILEPTTAYADIVKTEFLIVIGMINSSSPDKAINFSTKSERDKVYNVFLKKLKGE